MLWRVSTSIFNRPVKNVRVQDWDLGEESKFNTTKLDIIPENVAKLMSEQWFCKVNSVWN